MPGHSLPFLVFPVFFPHALRFQRKALPPAFNHNSVAGSSASAGAVSSGRLLSLPWAQTIPSPTPASAAGNDTSSLHEHNYLPQIRGGNRNEVDRIELLVFWCPCALLSMFLGLTPYTLAKPLIGLSEPLLGRGWSTAQAYDATAFL